MTILLNEARRAEEILTKGDAGSKPAATLFLLAKYYFWKHQLKPSEIGARLHEFMASAIPDYTPALWENIIEDISGKAGKYPLREIDSVNITEKELDTLRNLNNLKYEKLAFVMLCHAKLHDLISPDNHSWVNASIQDIYRTARVTVRHRTDKFLYLNDLEAFGLISFSSRNDNLNLHVNFVDSENRPFFHINDFRELGYEYMNYSNQGRFSRCDLCGRLYPRKTNNQKYCSDCSKVRKMARDRERMAGLRKKSLSENLQKP